MIFEGHSRFWAVTVGKASALSVLMMSLSNQLSTVVGVDYFNGPSFLACLVAALLLIALLKPLEKPVGRLALSMVNCVLSATWIVLLGPPSTKLPSRPRSSSSMPFRDASRPSLSTCSGTIN